MPKPLPTHTHSYTCAPAHIHSYARQVSNSSTSFSRYTHDLEVQQLCSVPENTELSHRFLIALLLLQTLTHSLDFFPSSHSIRCTSSQTPLNPPPGYHQYTPASTLHKHKPRTSRSWRDLLQALSRPIARPRPVQPQLLQLLQQLSRRTSFDPSITPSSAALQPVWTTLPNRLLQPPSLIRFSLRAADWRPNSRGGSKNLFRTPRRRLLLLVVSKFAQVVPGSSAVRNSSHVNWILTF